MTTLVHIYNDRGNVSLGDLTTLLALWTRPGANVKVRPVYAPEIEPPLHLRTHVTYTSPTGEVTETYFATREATLAFGA